MSSSRLRFSSSTSRTGRRSPRRRAPHLEAQGFGSGLLCTLVPFVDATGGRVGLVYLYKQGTFYPFAPQPDGGQRRDNLLEIQIRDLVKNDLPIEPQLNRWMPVWGAPGL